MHAVHHAGPLPRCCQAPDHTGLRLMRVHHIRVEVAQHIAQDAQGLQILQRLDRMDKTGQGEPANAGQRPIPGAMRVAAMHKPDIMAFGCLPAADLGCVLLGPAALHARQDMHDSHPASPH